jgi:hypothetical protein
MERDDNLIPESPHDAGVPEEDDTRIEDVEPVHLLANDARSRLERDGFTDAQILKWAEAYFETHREGDVDEFVDWIRRQERDA